MIFSLKAMINNTCLVTQVSKDPSQSHIKRLFCDGTKLQICLGESPVYVFLLCSAISVTVSSIYNI